MFAIIRKVFFYLLGFYTLFGFFILPYIVKSQLIQGIETNTYAKASVKSVAFNPFAFTIALDDFSLRDANNSDLVHFDHLYANVEPHSLLYGALHLKNLTLTKPHIYFTRNDNNTTNFSLIVKQSKEDTSPQQENKTQLPRIILDTIKLEDGALFFTDYTPQESFHFTFERMGILLSNIDTDSTRKKTGHFRFYTTLGDGGFIDFKTELTSLDPLVTHGSLKFEASKLYTEWRYIKDKLALEVADGKISLYSEYSFARNDINATHITNTTITLDNLRIKPKTKEHDILTLHSLALRGIDLYPLQQKGDVQSVALDYLSVTAQRDTQGIIDWIRYLQTKQTSAVAKKKKEQTPPPKNEWDVAIKDIALKNIDLHFNDHAIAPSVKSDIRHLNIYAKDVTTRGEKPFSYAVDMGINKKGSCSIKGLLQHKHFALTSDLACKDIDIVHYRPYIDTAAKQSLRVYNILLNSLQTDMALHTQIYEEKGGMVIALDDANLSLKKLRITKKTTKEHLFTLHKMSLRNAKYRSKTNDLRIADITLKNPNISLQRYKNKRLNIENLVVAKTTSKPIKKKKSRGKNAQTTPAFHIHLNRFALENARITFRDRAIKGAPKEIIDRCRLVVKDIDSNKRTWLRYNLALRVNKKGSIALRGKVRHTPLKQEGYFTMKNIPLANISPYLREQTYVRIDDGRIGMQGRMFYQQRKNKPDLRVYGKFFLNSLFINNTQDDSLLFSLNELVMKSFTLELFPNRLYIDEVGIDSFYVNAMIDEKKQLNFSQLIKKDTTKVQKKKEIKDTPSQQKENAPFAVTIAKIDVALGSAKFQDLSIPIKFKTDIHDLNGVIYAVSTLPGETTYVKLTGEIDKYGSTLLQGSVDSANPKKFTDLDFNFKNLDLSALSGYSAEFAGYKIDSGKLYLDLGYNIVNSQLNASNNIMIKKIKLGDEIEDKNVTHLPLGFVIGLLEDSDGIIDIDMPIEGNIDNPDFKYGALVFKTLGNLIAKAVTSPFKFLGSMLGINSDDLEYVEFSPAAAFITPPEREKLDTLAKMMIKRPKIDLRITPSYDKEKDTLGIQKQKLIALVLEKSEDKNIKDAQSALTLDMLEEIYTSSKEQHIALSDLQDRLEKKYEDNEKAYEAAYRKTLINSCLAMQKVSRKDLQTVAQKRVDAIVYYLTQEKHIDPKRVVVKNDFALVKGEKLIPVKLEIEVEVK